MLLWRKSLLLGLGLSWSLRAQHNSVGPQKNSEKRAPQKNEKSCDDIEGSFCQDNAVAQRRAASEAVAKRLRDAFLGSTDDRRLEKVTKTVALRVEAAGHVLDPNLTEEQRNYLLTPLHYRDPGSHPPIDPNWIPIERMRACRLPNGQEARNQKELPQVRAQIKRRLFELGDRNYIPDALIEREQVASRQNPELWVDLPSTLGDWQIGTEGRKSAMEALIKRSTEISQRAFEKYQSDLSSLEALWKEAFVYCHLSTTLNRNEEPCPDLADFGPRGGHSDLGYRLEADIQGLTQIRDRAKEWLINSGQVFSMSQEQKDRLVANFKQLGTTADVSSIFKKITSSPNSRYRVTLKDLIQFFDGVALFEAPPLQFFEVSSLCKMLAWYEFEDFHQIRERAAADASLEKSVVESVRNSAYPESERQILQTQFDDVKSRVSSLMDRNLAPKDPSFARVNDTKLYWPSSTGLFKKDADGVERLDLSQIPSHDPFYQTLVGDPYFSSGAIVNANFATPETHGVGLVGPQPRVMVLPGLLESTQDQPFARAYVLAHELGHALDPHVARQSGGKVHGVHLKTLDCLKSSMGMGDHQQGECFADLIATEVIAGMIMDQDLKGPNVPASSRDRVEQSLRFMCSARDGLHRPGEVHPHPRLRINAILGAHPKIRLALGCPEKGPFPYCGEAL